MIVATGHKRERFLAAVTAVVVVGATLFTIIIAPQLQRRKDRLNHLIQLQLNLAKMKSNLLIKDRIDRTYEKIEPLISSVGTDQQEISVLTRQLSELYKNLNVRIRSVKILPVENERFYRRLNLRVEMTGHIRDILQFIRSVEAHSSPLRIEKLQLSAEQINDNVRATFMITKVVERPQD